MSAMGAWVIAASAGLAVATAFLLRARFGALLVSLLLAAAGAGLGWGGVTLRDDPTATELAVTVALMAVLVPAHVRIVLGRFGPSARGAGIRAMADPAGPPR